MLTSLLLIIIYLSFISLGLPDSLLGSAWPSMYNTLNVPLHYAGYVSMITAAGTVISSIFSVRVIRRFGTGIVTAISVLMTAAALFGFSFSRQFVFLCLCAVPLGLGAGSVDAALNNYVALHFKARHMNWLHCFWGIGASAGPVIMSFYLIQKNSWNSGYRAIGIIQTCLVLILFISLPLWEKNTGGENSARHTPVKFGQLFHIAGVKQALAAFFCYCTLELVTGIWGASYLVIVKNVPPEIAAKWIALYYMGIAAGRFVSGFVTMKFNNRQMARLGQIITGCGIIVLILPFGNTMLLPGLFLIGLGCAPVFPALLHETPKNFGENYSQAIMGLQMGSAYVGNTLMPLLFGRIASIAGFAIFPAFIGIVLIMEIIMTATLNRKVDNAKK